MYVIIFPSHTYITPPHAHDPDGMIIFPTGGVFTNLGGVGVSMFFVSWVITECAIFALIVAYWDMVVFSAVIAQLVYSFGGSGFDGANGSMMIEVVVSSFPFYTLRPLTAPYLF